MHTWSGGVSAITVFDQISDTLLLAWLALLQQLNRLRLRQDIRAVTEVDAVHEKLKISEHKFNGFRFEFLAQLRGQINKKISQKFPSNSLRKSVHRMVNISSVVSHQLINIADLALHMFAAL